MSDHDTSWWDGPPRRLLQTNLRELDADLDPERFVAEAVEFGADVVLFNVGGILANYPTDHPAHTRNPHLRGDLVGEVLSRLHAAGMRMIGRFDFSKVADALAAAHPDWCYVGTHGRTVSQNGQTHACINGAYQQRHAMEILEEALRRYPLDGVFFNMIGYVTYDYDGIDYGPCQCASCRQRFGEDLPRKPAADDPRWRRYEDFKGRSSDALFAAIREHVRAVRPGTAVCTYTATGVDIIRSEANTGLARPKPEWNYAASEHVKAALGTHPGRLSANAAVHFIDFPYRHSAVSPALTRRRLAASLCLGAWMDYYVIGTVSGQEDRQGLAAGRELFAFHRRHAAVFTGARSLAETVLLRPSSSHGGQEFRGLYRLLSEARLPFDVVDDYAAAPRRPLADYRLIVVPDCRRLTAAVATTLDAAVAGGARLLATGFTGCGDADERPCLACLGGRIRRRLPAQPASYWHLDEADRSLLAAAPLANLEVLPAGTAWAEVDPEDHAHALRWIPPAMVGPPEKCYHGPPTAHPGLILRRHGEGAGVWLPWLPGSWYEPHGIPAVPALLAAILDGPLAWSPQLCVQAPPLVEVCHLANAAGAEWVGLINHAGQNGSAFHAALPIHDLVIERRGSIARARSLRRDEDLACERVGDVTRVRLPRLDDFEVVVLER